MAIGPNGFCRWDHKPGAIPQEKETCCGSTTYLHFAMARCEALGMLRKGKDYIASKVAILFKATCSEGRSNQYL